jgi:hypothetical protein
MRRHRSWAARRSRRTCDATRCARRHRPSPRARGRPGRRPGFRTWSGRRRPQDLPGSWATLRTRAPVSDPGGGALQVRTPGWPPCVLACALLPSAFFTASASTSIHLSGLNAAAHVPAVYASQWGSLFGCKHHARLASGWRSSTLAGWELHPRVTLKVSHRYMMIPFLQAFLAQEERWPARWRQRRRLSGLAADAVAVEDRCVSNHLESAVDFVGAAPLQTPSAASGRPGVAGHRRVQEHRALTASRAETSRIAPGRTLPG